MVTAILEDKIGRREALTARPGQTIREILRAHGIPANAVLSTLNGRVIAEDASDPVGPNDTIVFERVRHYDLSVVRDPPRSVTGVPKPVYTKSIAFQNGGDIRIHSEGFDEGRFAAYIEQVFVDSFQRRNLIPPDGRIVMGLSGGRDSVSFLKLLERTRDRLPKFQLVAVTVTGLPDWDEPATIEAARAACELAAVEHTVVRPAAVAEAFHLDRQFSDVMRAIVASNHRSKVMIIIHHVMRRMIEMEADRRQTRTVALGLNADDLLASLITWFTSGFRMGPIPRRIVGSHSYIFPLYRITKKELTLYLELVSPDLSRQGPPGLFTTGPEERSLAYAVGDCLYELWPGIDYYVLDAFEKMQSYFAPKVEGECQVCGASYLLQTEVDFRQPRNLCDVCALFRNHGFSTP